MSISPNVMIMTVAELGEIKAREYARGVARGRFEAAMDSSPTTSGKQQAVSPAGVAADAGDGAAAPSPSA